MTTDIARRSFLKGVAASPVAGHAMAQHLIEQTQLMALGNGYGAEVASPSAAKPERFLSFANWLKAVGEDEIRREARNIHSVDADIIEMRLPLATKARMQRARNYKRLMEEKRSWFDRLLTRDGKVEYWR